jgi:hypothetical protein
MGIFDRMAKKAVESALEAAEAFTGTVVNDDIVDGVEGFGTVAQVPVIDSHAQTYVQPLALVIELPGHEPYAAQPTTAFSRDRIPTKGQRLPVKVSRADPMRIAVLWDQIPSGLDAELAARRSSPEPEAAPSADVVGELERLAKLRADGALSDEEFAALKSRLFGLDGGEQPGV